MTPLRVSTFVSAMSEAQEISLKTNVPVYLFRITEGCYVIDTDPTVYSNEKLVIKLFKGERQD